MAIPDKTTQFWLPGHVLGGSDGGLQATGLGEQRMELCGAEEDNGHKRGRASSRCNRLDCHIMFIFAAVIFHDIFLLHICIRMSLVFYCFLKSLRFSWHVDFNFSRAEQSGSQVGQRSMEKLHSFRPGVVC